MELTRDDERARRICSLALDFMNATGPLSSSDIARTHYPELSSDSFRRAFSRDREMLAACGVVVRDRKGPSGESLWEADDERSFARGAELSPTDAAALEVSCRPLVEDPSFPLADSLRYALAKLARTFSESLAAGRFGGGGSSRELVALRRCLTESTLARVSYVDARGEASERVIAPYAFFGLRGALYLVAARATEKGEVEAGSERTYRVDRFARVEPVPASSYEIPRDFSVEDFRRLPFQMGPSVAEAVFVVPGEHEEALRRKAGAQGSFLKRGDATLWKVPVSDVSAAASWAISAGIVPREPAELVGSWRGILKGAADGI